MDVDYKGLHESNSEDLIKRRIDIKFHENGKGLARGDINSDGFVDLIATNSNGYIFDENGNGIMKGGPVFLWINQENENNWIKLRLVGSAIKVDGGSNADAIGSTVKIKYLENNETKYQIKSITSGESFISANSLNLNFGLGKRFLSDDKFSLTGLNAFLDYDDEGNLRSSIGLEIRNAVLDFSFNNYFALDDADGENVLDGYDLRLASQIPYVHWADIFINSYSWDGVTRDDVEGLMYGTEMLLSPCLLYTSPSPRDS